MDRITDIILRLGHIDRRIIFIIIGVAVLIPLFWPVHLPIRATDSSRRVYKALEALPAGSKILLSFEYGPSTKPEIHPMAISLLRYFFRKGHQVYATSLWPDGLFMSEEAFIQVAEDELDMEYGTDYVNLGFRPGYEAAVKGIASDITKMYTVDSRNTLIGEIPMMTGIKNIKDFDFLFSLSAGYPGSVEWVQYGTDPTGVPMSTGTTSIQVNEVLPYVATGQIKGILAGMLGAAEFEELSGEKGQASQMMAAQSLAHVVIVLFIIFGNLTYYIERRRAQKR